MSINSKKRRDEKKKKQKNKTKKTEVVSTGFMKKVSNRHMDVLQNIEMMIVTCHRQNPLIDDEAAGNALRYFLYGKESVDPRVIQIIDAIQQVRDVRRDIPEDVWKNCLRVVLDSIHTHSPMTKGATGYLDFVSDFVPKTKDNKPLFFLGDMTGDTSDDAEDDDLDDEEDVDSEEEDIEEDNTVYYEDMEDEEMNVQSTSKEEASHSSLLSKFKSYLGSKDKSHGHAE